MDTSLFLSQVIGLYYIVISVAFLLNEKKLSVTLVEMINSPSLTLISGFMALIIGILLIVSHNIWVNDWRVIITIIGWLAFTKGIIIMLFSDFLVKMSIWWMENKAAYYTTFVCVFLLGGFLLYCGYEKH